MLLLLFALAVVATGIIWAASRLAVYADAIAARFSISRSWIGLLFVSIVTTLPEATVTISAIAHVGRPDLALSNNFGSILFNLMVIAIADLVFRRGGILRFTQEKNALPVACAMTMLILVLVMLLFPIPLQIGPIRVGAGSILAIVVFVGLFVFMEKFEAREIVPSQPESREQSPPARHPVIGFAVCGIIVIVCAVALANLGDQLADKFALRHSFVGFILLAVITSLPELTFGISSVRIGAYDLLLGNIMGANMLNALVIAVGDIVHRQEVLSAPANIGMEQVLTGLLALLASTMILIGIINRRGAYPRRLLGSTSRLIILIYTACVLVMYFGIGGR